MEGLQGTEASEPSYTAEPSLGGSPGKGSSRRSDTQPPLAEYVLTPVFSRRFQKALPGDTGVPSAWEGAVCSEEENEGERGD